MAWPPPENTLDPRLLVALLGSALLHAAVLGLVGFTAPEPESSSGPMLRMVEYRPMPARETNSPDRDAPAASRSQKAAGKDEKRKEAANPFAGRSNVPAQEAPAPTPPEPDPKAEAEKAPAKRTPTEAPQKQPAPAPKEEELLSSPEAPEKRANGESSGGARSAPATPEKDSFQLYPSNRQMAQWDRNNQERRNTARETADRARMATREDKAASYISAWIAKVERIGNLNYPEEAQERDLTGKVRVEAVVRPDGTLAHLRILESSGSDILDAAAKQIIRLGAPYSTFPDALERRYADGLPIRHHFNFTRGSDLRAPDRG
ncbi:TonB family protein [Thiohalorhabdus methylotrophus]|uniref:Protein TonB n=1 Tax=Thiohalorhabdus methylotrophus TaxID=3242694 RepID=A0ABV4TQ14_9GAMM